MDKYDRKKINELLKAVLLLENIRESQKFFRDLLTEPELIEFSNRWKAARMLAKKIPYSRIIKETGLSSTTVARVSKWLQGGEGGYRAMLKKMNTHHRTPSSGKELR